MLIWKYLQATGRLIFRNIPRFETRYYIVRFVPEGVPQEQYHLYPPHTLEVKAFSCFGRRFFRQYNLIY